MTKTTLVFDPFSEEFFNNPYELYRRMREDAPVYYSEEYDFYALTRHTDVSAAYRDFETFSSSRGMDLSMVRTGEPPVLKSVIVLDPPEHRHMRGLVSRVFTPKAISSLKPVVADLVDHYLAQADPNGFDLVQDFSVLFPIEVVSRMLGVPEESRLQVRLWTDDLLQREIGQVDMSERGLQAVVELTRFYYELAKDRRAEPRDDMITQLVEAEVEREDGQKTRLSTLEIAAFASLLGGAGAETVAKLIGNAGVLFARFPDEWDKLLADRGRIPAAVEELLRYEAPNQYNVRYSMKEVTLHGVTIPAGKPVFLVCGSANRDPEAFTDPDVFDVDRNRSESPNLGFGYGIHSCLGAALARMESAVALDRLLDFMPRYEVDWSGCTRVTMQNVAGWNNVPVRVLR